MSYEFYKVLHIFAAFTVLMSLGGIALHTSNGGTREYANRKWIAMIHGIGLLLSLVGGFGLLARLGMMGGLPGWVLVKLCVWLALGAAPVLFYKKSAISKSLFFGVLLLATIAVAMAVYKPF
jgi:hypothetical protein